MRALGLREREAKTRLIKGILDTQVNDEGEMIQRIISLFETCTEKQAIEIRETWANFPRGKTLNDLQDIYGHSHSTLKKILYGHHQSTRNLPKLPVRDGRTTGRRGKLEDKDVIRIRWLRHNDPKTYTYQKLADMHGMHMDNIRQIILRMTYKHVHA